MFLKVWLTFLLFYVHQSFANNDDCLDLKNYKSEHGVTNNLFCYYGSWAGYRTDIGKFEPENIDPNICTHIIYSFAGLANNKIKLLDPYNDIAENYGKNFFGRITDLKKKNKNLKVLLAIGGWNEGSVSMSQMASNQNSRKEFVNSVVNLLKKYKFDGLDVDWEYPAKRGGRPQDKRNFVKLLAELKHAFKHEKLLLTAAIGAGNSLINSSYDVVGISKHLDFINLMTYDYHVPAQGITGHNSPLQDENNTNNNIVSSVNEWIRNGVDKRKLILGIPTYGHSYTLANQVNNNLGASTNGPGTAGPNTKESGMLAYYEICKTLNKYTKVNPKDKSEAPYLYSGNQWISYDDEKSVNIKAKYANCKGLGGAMIWSIENDDFRGICGKKYPLLNSIRDGLNLSSKKVSHVSNEKDEIVNSDNDFNDYDVTKDPDYDYDITENPDNNLEKENHKNFVCVQDGFFKNENDCSKYYRCVKFNEQFIKYDFSCATGTVFNEENISCDWNQNALKCGN